MTRVLAALLAAALAAGCQRDPSAVRDGHLDNGDALSRSAKYPQATVEYQKAITADPTSGEAHFKLAQSYLHVGLGQFALQEALRAAALLPERVDVQLQAASLLLDAGRFEESEAHARRAVDIRPDNPAVHFMLGDAIAAGIRVSTDAGGARVDAAVAAYRRGIDNGGDLSAGHVGLGRLYAAVKRPADAEASFRKAMEASPGNVTATQALARLYLATDREREAEPLLRALAQTLRTPGAFLDLADFYTELGRLDEAKGILESLVEVPSADLEARLKLASIEYRLGHRVEAHQLVDAILVERPENARASLLKARLLEVDGRLDEAIVRARTAVQAEPESVAARRDLARLYARASNRDEAIRQLRDSRTEAPEASNARVDLAQLYLERGEPVRARDAGEAAVRLAPSSIDAAAIYARGLTAAGDLQKAKEVLDVLPPKAQSSIAVLTAKADLAMATKNYTAARAAFERALAMNRESVSALSGLTDLDLAEHRYGAARARLDRAPDTLEAFRRLLRARVAAASGDRAGAERDLRALVRQRDRDADAWLALADLLRGQCRLSDARAAAEQAVRHQPAWPRATLVLGEILTAQDQSTEANALYERFVKVDPDAAEVKGRLRR